MGQRFLASHRRNRVVARVAGFGRRLALGYENHNNYDFHTNGEADVLKRLIDKGFTTIFDVGANTGAWSLLAGIFFPDAVIHCFEPIPETCRNLRDRLSRRPEVVVNDFGLSDTRGTRDFKLYPSDLEKSSLYDYPHPLPSARVECRIESGDRYLEDNGIDRIDFLKIDVEGAEHLVLAGFERAFRQGRIQVVQFEYGLINILTRFLLLDYYRFFERFGYTIGKIYPGYVDFRPYSLGHEDFIGPNYLAVSRDGKHLIESLS